MRKFPTLMMWGIFIYIYEDEWPKKVCHTSRQVSPDFNTLVNSVFIFYIIVSVNIWFSGFFLTKIDKPQVLPIIYSYLTIFIGVHIYIHTTLGRFLSAYSIGFIYIWRKLQMICPVELVFRWKADIPDMACNDVSN